ncbi:MAG: hypothetical protein FWG32_03245 [Oscillospiraceae bacterium]|nr:hypothetical protein [Oscillospiraceae bacterium]
MKERIILPISIIFGAVLILAGLITLSNAIRNRPFAVTSNIPSSIEVKTEQASEYMYEWEAAGYIRIDYDSFNRLLNEGKLNGTYIEMPVQKTVPDEKAYAEMFPVPEGAPSPAMPVTTVNGVERVFFRSELDKWMTAQISP